VLGRSIGDHLPDDGRIRLHVLDSTDPATIRHLTEGIDVATTLFFVSSKSGTTIEANCLFAYFYELVRAAKGERAGENFVAITDADTPLQTLATEHGFRRTFVNPGDIGGRYSALSYFGLAPAAAAGLDVGRPIQSGIDEQERSRGTESDALLLGSALGELALAGRDKCTLLISPAIATFGLWAEQLIAESTGKEGKGILPIAGEPLIDAAHYSQDRFFVFLRLTGDDNAPLDVHAAAVEAAGHPVIRIDLDDAYDLGREFFRWEFAVAIAGKVLGINPFDEPNVQESKDNTNRVLAELERTGEIAIDVVDPGSLEIGSAVDAFVARIEPGGYFAITSYASATSHSEVEFDDMRRAVAERYGVATTLGYGPRFLHSTGQFHKGGTQEGAFLQVLGEIGIDGSTEGLDVAIPGKGFTFGQLKRAQAAGDRESLSKRGRPVVTVDLGNDFMMLEMLCQSLTATIEASAKQGG
jgi:hypothetical protein